MNLPSKLFAAMAALILTISPARAADGFTPTSGFEWFQNGSWGAGVEFVALDGSYSETRLWPIPVPAKTLTFSGTFNLHPNRRRVATLLRIWAIGDPNGEPVLCFNGHLSAIFEPQHDYVQSQSCQLPPPGPDGSLQLKVEIETAGAGGPAGTEIEFSGNWTK